MPSGGLADILAQDDNLLIIDPGAPADLRQDRVQRADLRGAKNLAMELGTDD